MTILRLSFLWECFAIASGIPPITWQADPVHEGEAARESADGQDAPLAAPCAGEESC
jgi:hypothetical protein